MNNLEGQLDVLIFRAENNSKTMQHLILVPAAAMLPVGIAAAASPKAASDLPARRPNVLMISVDDCNVSLGGAFGCSQAVTPNLDRLMASGLSFTNCQTAASFSTPSRTALLTGMAPWNSGCYENQPHLFNIPDRTTLDELFKKNGYATFGGGKVYHHMPGYVNLDGFDEYYIWNPEHKKKGWPYQVWNDSKALPGPMPLGELGKAVYENFDVFALPDSVEQYMGDTMTAEWAAEVLGREHSDPFFLAVGLYAPHKANYCPQKYFDLHPLSEIDLSGFRLDEDYFQTDSVPDEVVKFYKGRINKQHVNGILTVEDGWKKAVQGYLACCSYADAQIGKVLSALANSPYADNTIVIFWSDNGYHLGEKQLWAKHTSYKQTTNVPMVWSGPGIRKDKVYRGMVSLMDIFPTLMDLCGLEGDSEPMDGQSISGILHTLKGDMQRSVVMALQTRGFCVLTRKWHYNYYTETGAEELFDRENDPIEYHNLAADPTYTTVIKRLKKSIPAHPAAPGASPNAGCKLVCEGESFHWIPFAGR